MEILDKDGFRRRVKKSRDNSQVKVVGNCDWWQIRVVDSVKISAGKVVFCAGDYTLP